MHADICAKAGGTCVGRRSALFGTCDRHSGRAEVVLKLSLIRKKSKNPIFHFFPLIWEGKRCVLEAYEIQQRRGQWGRKQGIFRGCSVFFLFWGIFGQKEDSPFFFSLIPSRRGEQKHRQGFFFLFIPIFQAIFLLRHKIGLLFPPLKKVPGIRPLPWPICPSIFIRWSQSRLTINEQMPKKKNTKKKDTPHVSP